MQNNTNTELNEIMKVISDVKSEFHKQIETLKRSKGEMKTKFKNSIFPLEYSAESLAKRMTQAEERTPEFKNKLLNLDQIYKKDKIIFKYYKQTFKKYGIT